MRKAAQAEVDEQKRDRILKDADLVEVIVAPRRSVIVSAVIDFQMVDGLRQPVFGPKTCGPGETVSIAAGEIPLLVERGFVLDPAQPIPEEATANPVKMALAQDTGGAA